MQTYKLHDCFYTTTTDVSGHNRDYVLRSKTWPSQGKSATFLPTDRMADPISGKGMPHLSYVETPTRS